MKFELLFFPKGHVTCSPEAYVGALPTGSHNPPDPRSGHFLLTHETCSEQECHREIDKLIQDLQKLKREASLKFQKPH